MGIKIAYYKFNNPGFPKSERDYAEIKQNSLSGRKIDFYGYKAVLETIKSWLLILIIPLLLIILLNIKVYYLPTDGAVKTLDFMYTIMGIAAFGAFIPLFSLLIVLLRAYFYNKKLNSSLSKSTDYHDWENCYRNKKK